MYNVSYVFLTCEITAAGKFAHDSGMKLSTTSMLFLDFITFLTSDKYMYALFVTILFAHLYFQYMLKNARCMTNNYTHEYLAALIAGI